MAPIDTERLLSRFGTSWTLSPDGTRKLTEPVATLCHQASMHPRDVADHGQDDDKTEQIEKGA
jgi:hypothetical protein